MSVIVIWNYRCLKLTTMGIRFLLPWMCTHLNGLSRNALVGNSCAGELCCLQWVYCIIQFLRKANFLVPKTHNIHAIAPISEFVVSLGLDGQILSQGSISDALEKNANLRLEVAKEAEVEEKAKEEIDPSSQLIDVEKRSEGKLILEEEVAEGHLSLASGRTSYVHPLTWCSSFSTVKMYFVALGGRHWFWFWFWLITAIFFASFLGAVQTWLLGAWATQYQNHPVEEVNVGLLVIIFSSEDVLTWCKAT